METSSSFSSQRGDHHKHLSEVLEEAPTMDMGSIVSMAQDVERQRAELDRRWGMLLD